jgi:hypothetical protein
MNLSFRHKICILAGLIFTKMKMFLMCVSTVPPVLTLPKPASPWSNCSLRRYSYPSEPGSISS